MKIGIDCDCTTADFVGGICRIAQEKDRSVASEWNWYLKIYPQETVDKIQSSLRDPTWWTDLPLIKDAEKGIAWLRGQGHEIIWITVPYPMCEGWYEARREWLEKHFRISQHNESLITVNDFRKYRIRADAIIDDIPEVIDAYWQRYPQTICLTFKSELNRNLDRKLVTWEDIMGMRAFYHGTSLTSLSS